MSKYPYTKLKVHMELYVLRVHMELYVLRVHMELYVLRVHIHIILTTHLHTQACMHTHAHTCACTHTHTGLHHSVADCNEQGAPTKWSIIPRLWVAGVSLITVNTCQYMSIHVQPCGGMCVCIYKYRRML